MRRTPRASCVMAAAATALLAAAGTADATFEGRNGRIAFARDGKIYTIEPDGRALRLLTPKGKGRAAPTWSRDGSRIAFLRYPRRGGVAVFVMRADGSQVRRVGAHPERFIGPAAWRPVGRQLLYDEHSGDTDPAVGAIKLVRSDGSGRRNLTGDRDLSVHPSWSPDGRRIAFVRVVGGDPQGFGTPGGEIWIMNADGSGQAQVTRNDVLDEGPAWSPDGARIAFKRTVPGVGQEGDRGAALWTMNPDGSDEKPLTTGDGAFDGPPEWSPDGRRLLFTRAHVGGRSEAFTINPDGSGLTRIAESRRPLEVDWSPDSRRVLIAAGRTITVARADGTKRRTLTRGSGFVDWKAR